MRYHRFIAVSFWGGLALLGLGGAWSYVRLSGATTPLITRFSPEEGIIQTGSYYNVLAFLFFGFVLHGINSALAALLKSRMPFWGAFFAGITLVLDVLIFVAIAAMITANT